MTPTNIYGCLVANLLSYSNAQHSTFRLQCFDAVGWTGIRAVKTERWGAGVVISLERGADFHMAQRVPLPLSRGEFGAVLKI